MPRNIPLFFVFLLAFAIHLSAQAPAAVRVNTGGQSFDPLGILESEDDSDKKAAGVKAAVFVNMAGVERRAFDLINKERARHGLSQLAWSSDLVEVARVHSRAMAEFQFFSHRGLDNKMVSDRADAQNIGRWRAIGENIAFNRGHSDPVEKAVQLWLGSPEHRRNMLDAGWKESAIGVAVAADGSYYFTHVFLTRK